MRIITLFLLLPFCSYTQSKLQIAQLTGDFYIYTTYNSFNGTAFPSNGMYIVSTECIVLIDTPWDKTQFQPLLDSIQKRHNKKAVLCIATHYHDDRTAGLDYFSKKGIKTFTSKQTDKLSAKHGEQRAEFHFKKDTVFKVGNHTFETFYPGKGHTEDNIVIWFENEKILYGGCFIKSTDNQSLGNIADADVKAWPKSIRKTMKKFPDARFIIPGHFYWNGNGLEHTLKLLEN